MGDPYRTSARKSEREEEEKTADMEVLVDGTPEEMDFWEKVYLAIAVYPGTTSNVAHRWATTAVLDRRRTFPKLVKQERAKGDRTKSPCKHLHLFNRGSPPNLSNQRVCADCDKTFLPPRVVGGTCISVEDGEEVVDR